MKHFTFKQCAVALCLSLATFLPGKSIATNAPDVSSPIGITLAEQEESGYAFKSWNTHAEYEQIYKNDNGTYRGSRGKQMWLELPSETSSKIYLKARLKNVEQANSITFQVNWEDRPFNNGAIWINPEDCSQYGTTQDIPFGARVTAPGVYPYTVEAYISQDDETPVAIWDATFYFMENMPSITMPSNIYSGSFNVEVTMGDLTIPANLSIQLDSNWPYDPMSLTVQGLTQDEENSNRWVSTIQPMTNVAYACKLAVEGHGVGNCSVQLRDADGNYIRSYYSDVLFPFNPAQSDMDALTRLAQQNDKCTELVEYIQQGKWVLPESEQPEHVSIRWEHTSPTHVYYLRIQYQEDSLKLNLAGLDSIRTLDLDGNKALAPMNLSHLVKLERLDLYSEVNLTYQDIQFPKGFERRNVNGESKIWQIGTQRDNWSVEVPNNTIIDLTAYVGEPIEGSTTTYNWRKNWNDVQLTPIQEGTFKLHGDVNDEFYCEIRNDSFPNWRITTPDIYLTQGVIIFDSTEIAGIKKLATDNPHTTEFQEFVDKELWKEQTWDNWEMNYPIQLKWAVDEENNGRLVGLKLQASGWDHYPTKVDLRAFPKLQQFTTYDAERIDTLDVSNCTELQKLELYNNRVMTMLDLSACTKLKEVWLYADVLQTLKEPVYTQLEVFALGSALSKFDPSSKSTLRHLELRGNDNFTSLDLAQLPNLEEARLSWFHQLQTLDLSSLSKLKKLYFNNCSNIASIVGLNNLQLTDFQLYSSDFLSMEQLNSMDFSKLTFLSLEGSHYALPDASKLQQLQGMSVPAQLTELDMDLYPQLTSMWVYNSEFRYSGIKNYKQKAGEDENGNWQDGMHYWGYTYFDLPGATEVENEWYPCIHVGDTIDLSTEAIVNGMATNFIWVDAQYNTEEKSLFQPTDKPGVFVVSANVPINEEARFWCKIWNKAFASDVTVNSSNGWIMQTNHFKVLGGQASDQVFEQTDVEALATIVNNSKNPELKNWFSNEGWKTNGDTDLNAYGRIQIEWSDEPTKRLTKLALSAMFELLTGTIDVSALDRLEQLELPLTHVSAVKLPTNPEKLNKLNLGNTKVVTLDLTAYTHLLYLNLQNTGLKRCDLSKNTQLEQLRLGGTTIALDENTVYDNLTYFVTADNIASLDLNQMPKLETLEIMNDQLKFSDVNNAHQLSSVSGDSYLTASDVVYKDASMVAKEAVLDFSSELLVGTTLSTIHGKDSLIMTDVDGKYKVNWDKAKLLCIDLTNDMFPGWTLHYPMSMLTEKGDVNYDEQVNVQDVTATAAHLVDLENQLVDYSLYAGDVNENEEIDAGDLVGIVNIIMNKPFTKSSELRAAYRPTVDVQMDEKNFLTMENEVPVAALYLEIAGANAETTLLADAARMTQASSLKGDTLRIVAYSLDGRTIASGKHIIAQLQPGMRIVKATFSDAQAALLQTTGELLSTANETIASEVEAKAIYNYPNPTAGQTTFCYALAQPAQSVEVQFFASNGAFVARLQGLPTAAGSQSYATTLPLSAGVYYYRLVIDGKQVTATNTLIIK